MFKFVFGRTRKSSSNGEPPNRLIKNTEKAIAILGKLEGSLTDREILGMLGNNGIDLSNARQIVIFLPVAFCRQLLPTVAWKDQYYDKAGEVKKFSQTEPYLVIWQVTSSYFSSEPDKDVIMKIGGRSAEFHVINELLNAGGKLEEIELTPMRILM